MKNTFRPAARFVVINEKNEILLVRQNNFWAIPGGGIDFGESIFSAVSREAEEELGIKAETDTLVFLQDYTANRKGELTHFVEYFWTIENNEDFENVRETYKNATHAFELKDVAFFRVEDFPKDFMPKAFPGVMKKYLDNRKEFGTQYVSAVQ